MGNTNPCSGTKLCTGHSRQKSHCQRPVAIGLIAFLVISFVIVNAITSLSFAPWVDEVMQVDAGINLHLGKGWVSTAWQHQSQFEFWSANNPLYTFLVFLWVSLVGIGPILVRALNYVVVLADVWLILHICRRRGLLTSVWLCILLASLIACNSAVTYVYRSGRADLITLFVVAALAWPYMCTENAKKRRCLLFLGALPLVASGLQSVPFIVLLIALESTITRKSRLADLIAVLVGAASGCLLLSLLYAEKRTLRAFFFETFASGYNIAGSGIQALLIHDHWALARFANQLADMAPWRVVEDIMRDHSIIPVIIFLIISTLFTGKSRLHSTLLVGLVAAFFIPFGMLFAGRYPIYYSWMGSVPVLILFVVVLEQLLHEHRRVMLGVGFISAFASLILGLPFDIWDQTRHASPQSYAVVEQLLRNEVRSGDEVFGDPVLYYAAKNQSIPFYSSSYAGGRAFRRISDGEASRINLLILKPYQYDESKAKVGGDWSLQQTYWIPYGFSLAVWRRTTH